METRQELEDQYVEGKRLVEDMLKLTVNVPFTPSSNEFIRLMKRMILAAMLKIRMIEKEMGLTVPYRPGIEEELKPEN